MLSLVLTATLLAQAPPPPNGAVSAQVAAPTAAAQATAAEAQPTTAASQASSGEPFDAPSAGALEVGILGGYAVGKVYDPERTPTSFAQALVRLGVHFGATFEGRMRGNFALVAEGVGIAIDQDPRATGGGINLLIRYTWAGRRWRPSFLGGAGVIFTDEQVPPGETTHNFSPQAGLGLTYVLSDAWALGGEYRFHHVSNKGASESNPGINSHLFLFGVSWFP